MNQSFIEGKPSTVCIFTISKVKISLQLTIDKAFNKTNTIYFIYFFNKSYGSLSEKPYDGFSKHNCPLLSCYSELACMCLADPSGKHSKAANSA